MRASCSRSSIDETKKLMDKDVQCDVKSYASMREWLGATWEKQAGRTMVRGHQRSTRMEVGALVPDANVNIATGESTQGTNQRTDDGRAEARGGPDP